LYLFGGAEGENIFDDLIEFDMVKLTWSEVQIKSRKPTGRNSHSMCEWDGKLVLFGGHDGNNHLNDLLVF
jgi:N-acetylneuraminic acid mutarotase